MSFKNSLKILIYRFNLVWKLLLFCAVFMLIITGVSLSFLIPIIKAISKSGISAEFSAVIRNFLDGGSLSELTQMLNSLLIRLKDIVLHDTSIVVNGTLWVALVMIILSRFVLGFYELPLIYSLQSTMSYNAKLSYSSCFAAQFKKSLKFIPAKMIYTILFDSVGIGLIYGVYRLCKNAGLIIFIPFAVMLVNVLVYTFRYSFKVYWAPAVVVEKEKIYSGFFKCMKESLSDFGRIFSNYLVTWITVFLLNILVLLLTFGVGLIVTIPLSMVFVSTLDMALFYKKRGMSYYTDNCTVVSMKENENSLDNIDAPKN